MKSLIKIVVWIAVILAVAFVIQLVAFLYLSGQGPFSGGPDFPDESRIETLRWALFSLAGIAVLIGVCWIAFRGVRRERPNQRLQLTGDARELTMYSAGAVEGVPPRAAGN